MELALNVLLIVILSVFMQCRGKEGITVRDIDGNQYNTILAGGQLWMKENLKTTRFSDGLPIQCISDSLAWLRSRVPAYCLYNNDTSFADTLGYLYNWHAVSTGKLCPPGWRVPTDDEWKLLEGFTDSKYKAGDPEWDRRGLRGYDAGQKLRSVKGWRSAVPGTDSIGFAALPGGERLTRFFAGGSSGFWWTSTGASEKSAIYRSLIYSFEQVARDTHPERMGFSVRCIREKAKD